MSDIGSERDAEQVFKEAVAENKAATNAYADEALPPRVERTYVPGSVEDVAAESFRTPVGDDLPGGY